MEGELGAEGCPEALSRILQRIVRVHVARFSLSSRSPAH